MERILRIEDTDGNGLYNYTDYPGSLAARLEKHFPMDGCDHQPPPSDDGMTRGDTVPDMRYGFMGVGQLTKWLGDCPLDELYAAAGRVVVVDVRKIDAGYSQCRYDPVDVIKTRHLTLEELNTGFVNGYVDRFAN